VLTLQQLIASTATLNKIPSTSAKSYEAAQERMIHSVNRAVLQHPDIDSLLGENSADLVDNNHLNHASFMLEVLVRNDFELLVRTLPWVYRAYHNQGVDFDYFPLELRAWVAAIEQELTDCETAPIVELYQWMLSQHEHIIELSDQDESVEDSDPDSGRWFHTRAEFKAALDNRDHETCLEICRDQLAQGVTLPEIFNGIVYPVMVEVGVNWEYGKITVADEHEATAIVNRVISGLYFLVEKPKATRSVALVCAAPGERHEMGAWMVAISLELDGWDVIYLGADTPSADIAATAVKNEVNLVALSVAMPFGMTKTRELVDTLRGSSSIKSAKIMIGGGLFVRFPFMAEDLDVDGCFADSIKAVNWARTAVLEAR